MKTKVKKTESHDRLAVSASFPTGGSFKFSISRSGERMSAGCSNDKKEGDRQFKILANWVKPLSGETNGQRVGRIAAFVGEVESVSALVASIENNCQS